VGPPHRQLGATDGSFGNGGDALVDQDHGSSAATALAIASNGATVVVGTDENDTSPQPMAFRLQPNGRLDAGFGSAGVRSPLDAQCGTPSGVAVRSDGEAVVACPSELLLLDTSGALDTTFGSAGALATAAPSAAALQLDGGAYHARKVRVAAGDAIVVAGDATAGSSFMFVVARYSSSGAFDSSFGSGGLAISPVLASGRAKYESAHDVAIGPDGSIVIAGQVDTDLGVQMTLARFTANGSFDTTFGSSGSVQITPPLASDFVSSTAVGVGLQSDGQIVAGGVYGPGVWAARFSSAGQLDSSYGGPFRGWSSITKVGFDSVCGQTCAIEDTVAGLVMDGQDRAIIAGTTDYYQNLYSNHDGFLIRLLP
jgi:uncharacterized delta-60 repeat protein